MSTNYDQNLPLECFIRKISNPDDTKIGIVHGLGKVETNHLIRDSVELVADSETRGRWKPLSGVDHFEYVRDIEDILLENARPENLGSHFKEKGYISLRRRFWAFHVQRRLARIKALKVGDDKTTSRTRTILWTIVSALSSLGLAMGIPLFSLLLYRQDEIIDGYGPDHKDALGSGFFVGFLAFSIALIVLAILGTVVSLLNNLVSQRREYTWQNIDKLYKRFIKRYFHVEGKKWGWSSPRPWTFTIRKQYFFFYTNVQPGMPNYNGMLNLFKVLQMLDSVVIFATDDDENFNLAKVVPTGTLDAEDYEVFDLGIYRPQPDSAPITNFVFREVKRLSGLNPAELMAKYPLFVNTIYRFIDYSTTNRQLLDFCLQVKNLVGQYKPVAPEMVDYFVDLVTIAAFKGLDPVIYTQFQDDLLTNGLPSKWIEGNIYYQMLQIEDLLNRNLLQYRGNGLLFQLGNFVREGNYFQTVAAREMAEEVDQTTDEVAQKIRKVLAQRGYQEIASENAGYDLVFESCYADRIYVIFADRILADSHAKPLDLLKKIMVRGAQQVARELVISLYGEKQFYQLIDRQYTLIPNFFH